MLLFMYKGDYAPEAALSKAYGTKEPLQEEPTVVEAFSQLSLQTSPSTQSSRGLAESSPYVHVKVYAIARHYRLPDLQVQAMDKFKDASKAMTMSELFETAKALHQHEIDKEDEMSKELLYALMNTHIDWFAEASFWSALQSDTDLHPFAVRIAAAAHEKSIERESILKTEIEAYKAAKVQSDLELEYASENSKEAKSHIASLAQDLRNSEAANRCAENESRSTKEWSEKLFEEAQTNVVAVKERDAIIQELTERNRQLEALAQQKERDLEEDTARANKLDKIRQQEKNDEVERERNRANELAASLQQKEQELQKETTRASKYFESSGKKDHRIKELTEKSNQTKADYDSILRLINSLEQCRHCGNSFEATVENQGGEWLLRCDECRTRHFKYHI